MHTYFPVLVSLFLRVDLRAPNSVIFDWLLYMLKGKENIRLFKQNSGVKFIFQMLKNYKPKTQKGLYIDIISVFELMIPHFT